MSGGFFSGWAAHLAEPAVRALALALIAALALARTKDASLKFLAWKAVLAAALAMPILGALVPGLPVALPRPAWMATASKSDTAVTNADAALSEAGAGKLPLAGPTMSLSFPRGSTSLTALSDQSKGKRESTVDRSRKQTAILNALRVVTSHLNSGRSPSSPERNFSWQFVAVIIYLMVAAALLVRLLAGWILGRRLLSTAVKLTDPRAESHLAEQASALRLHRLPALVTSPSVAVPVTIGALAPVIVLPESSIEWDERKWRAVLAHELSHVARRDALTFLLSQFHRCLFWFSPLAWWLDRKLRALAEQASDDWALERVRDRIYYAELLLGFWKDLDGRRMRIRFEGASMAKGNRMHERVERVLSARANWSRRMRKSLAVGAALVAVPVVYFAAALKPAVAPQEPAPPAPAVAPVRPVAPSPATAPAKPVGGVFGIGQMPAPGTPPVAPTPAVAPAAPCGGIVAPAMAPVARVPIPPELGMPTAPSLAPAASVGPCVAHAPGPTAAAVALTPVAPQQPEAAPTPELAPTNEFEGNFYMFGHEDEEEGEHYVVVSGDSISMSGSSDDAHRAKKLRSKIEGDYIWFHRDEKEYVITDPKTVEQAKALFAPQEELGRKQEALGKMQEELGAQQEELGKHMEEVRVKLPDLRKELKELEAKLSDIDTLRTQEELGELQAELGEMQARIGEQMAQAGGMQGELGAKQGVLGAKQGELGRRQGELGREQGRLAREANRKMKSLLDDSIASGLAKPAPK